MSAFAGCVRFDRERVDEHELRASMNAIAHRGPDGCAVTTARGAVFGYAHFQTSVSPTRLPCPVKEGSLHLTGDIAVHNRRELVRALRSSRHISNESSDSALVLAAYRSWGQDCANRIIGDFAFAIWDADREELFCARDALGVRSFYFARISAGALVFGTEIGAVLAHPEVPDRINDRAVELHLEGSYRFEREVTFYKHVYRLPAGHVMHVDRTGVRRRRYWSLDPGEVSSYSSDEDCQEAFRACFEQAVRCRIPESGPVGTALSGGLDSSSVTCMAHDLAHREGFGPVHGFSVEFSEIPSRFAKRADERSYVDQIVRGKPGLRHHYLPAIEGVPMGGLDAVLRGGYQPLYGANTYIDWMAYTAARRKGCRVFLDGLDGDTVVSHGMFRLTELAIRGGWDQLEEELRALAQRYRPAEKYIDAYVYPYLDHLGRTGSWKRLIQGSWHVSRRFDRSFLRLLGRASIRPKIERLIGRDRRLGRGRDPGPNAEGDSRSRDSNMSFPTTEREAHVADLLSGKIQSSYTEPSDVLGGLTGVEVRSPFLDRRLVELCAQLPADQKLRSGWSRYILRASMRGIVPDAVRWRPDKADLSGPFLYGVWRDRSMLVDMLEDGEQTGFVLERKGSPSEVRRLLDRFTRDPLNGEDAGLRLFRAFVVARWLAGEPHSYAVRV